jgi:hypothetical protein
MTSPSENEKEKILDRISFLKEEIWETRSYISSESCRRCSEMYSKIYVLEQELKKLEQELSDDNS